MADMVFKSLCLVLLLVACHAEDDLQKWSITTKIGEPVTLACKDSFEAFLTSTTSDYVMWRKKDHEDRIQNDNVYTVSAESGMADMYLHFNASDDTNGIYFCEVTNTKNTIDTSDDELVGVVVKGVNIGLHNYDDFLDEYERNLVVGVIAAGSVFFLVVSLGLIGTFQYESEEDRADRLHHKTEFKRREAHSTSPYGYDNSAITTNETPSKNDNVITYPIDDHNNMNTAF